MTLHHAIDNRQTEAGAIGLAAGRVEAGERAQHILDLVFRQAATEVGDLEHDLTAVHTGGDIDFGDQAVVGFALAARILDQVNDYPLQLGGIAAHPEPVGNVRSEVQIGMP